MLPNKRIPIHSMHRRIQSKRTLAKLFCLLMATLCGVSAQTVVNNSVAIEQLIFSDGSTAGLRYGYDPDFGWLEGGRLQGLERRIDTGPPFIS